MDFLQAVLAVVGSVTVVAVTYFFNQRAERRSRSEQYQLEKIEEIIRVVVNNAETRDLPADSEVSVKALLETKQGLEILKIYGSPEACEAAEREDAPAILNALEDQARKLLMPRWGRNI